jgi:hypothetical protein
MHCATAKNPSCWFSRDTFSLRRTSFSVINRWFPKLRYPSLSTSLTRTYIAHQSGNATPGNTTSIPSSLLEQGEKLTEAILNDLIGHIEKETLIFTAQWALELNFSVGAKQELLRYFLEPKLRDLFEHPGSNRSSVGRISGPTDNNEAAKGSD